MKTFVFEHPCDFHPRRVKTSSYFALEPSFFLYHITSHTTEFWKRRESLPRNLLKRISRKQKIQINKANYILGSKTWKLKLDKYAPNLVKYA